MDISIDTIDFRLLEIDLELYGLKYHLDLLEKQIKNIQAYDRLSLENRIKKLGLVPDDADWQLAHNALEDTTEFFIPRIFRASFIISLYAVYESAVTEIAELIRKKKGIEISINDLRNDFLNRADKYFKDVLHFQLCPDKRAGQRINVLSVIRNAVAHANGRIGMLKPGQKRKITNYEKQNIGISSLNDFLVIEEAFLRETLSLVDASLNDLVARYKEWDDKQTSP